MRAIRSRPIVWRPEVPWPLPEAHGLSKSDSGFTTAGLVWWDADEIPDQIERLHQGERDMTISWHPTAWRTKICRIGILVMEHEKVFDE